jgi:hypothetical protein
MTDPDVLIRPKMRGGNPYADAVHAPHKFQPGLPSTSIKIASGPYPALPYNIEAAREYGHFVAAGWAAIYRLIAREMRQTWKITDAFMEHQTAWHNENHEALIEAAVRLVKQTKNLRQSDKPRRDAEDLLEVLYRGSMDEASSDDILKTIQAVFGWISGEEFDTVDYCLKSADADRLAPELQLALLRTTSRFRSKLPAWDSFFQSAKKSLTQRGFDVVDLLQGL